MITKELLFLSAVYFLYLKQFQFLVNHFLEKFKTVLKRNPSLLIVERIRCFNNIILGKKNMDRGKKIFEENTEEAKLRQECKGKENIKTQSSKRE